MLAIRQRFHSLTQSLTTANRRCRSFLPPLLSSPYSSNRDSGDAPSRNDKDTSSPPSLFVVQPRIRPDSSLQVKLNEALCLANSLEEQREGSFDPDLDDKPSPPHLVVQNPIFNSARPRADTFFGAGTVDTVKCHIDLLESEGQAVDVVFVNSKLTAVQQRNLERKWGKPVLDRVGLIIEIFNAHAHTKEAKLQAELAALMYKKSRLVRVRGPDGRSAFGESGESEVVSARGRGSGGRGFISGAGETELQLQRRRILERRNRLLSEIEELRRTRALHRAARKRHGGLQNQELATVAVVGYTNAGKSTLVSALSESDLYCDSRLFATLDTRLKSVDLPSGRKVLLSDTVGFISDLPVQLVDAFHATLEEVVEADLLVSAFKYQLPGKGRHLIDCTAPNLDEHRATVFQVLQQIGVSEEKLQDMIEVWNKIDNNEEDKMDGNQVDSGEDMEGEVSGAEDDWPTGSTEAKPEEVIFEEITDDEQGDCSGSWLRSVGDQETAGDNQLKSLDEQGSEAPNCSAMEKDLQSRSQQGPHVKISARAGFGLRELLELIDERLKIRDEKLKSKNVVERGYFDRKWRPPKTKDAGIAAEQ